MKKEERDIYDRQIRIWGRDVQERLIISSCLVITDSLQFLYETLKNLFLIGIQQVFILSDSGYMKFLQEQKFLTDKKMSFIKKEEMEYVLSRVLCSILFQSSSKEIEEFAKMKKLFHKYPFLVLKFHNENCHIMSNLNGDSIPENTDIDIDVDERLWTFEFKSSDISFPIISLASSLCIQEFIKMILDKKLFISKAFRLNCNDLKVTFD